MRRVLAVAAVIYAVSFLLVARPESQGNPQHGRDIFRYDTFGDEQLWTTFLRMNEVVGTVRPVDAGSSRLT